MDTNNRSYYDIDFDFDAEPFRISELDDVFYLKDLKQRKLRLETEVAQDSVSEIVRHILQYNKEDAGIDPAERQPILLYVSTDGGVVDAGFELIDVILQSKTPVYTINLGYQYSMGFLIGLAGHKRYATANAKFLMHDGSNFVYNSSTKAQDQMKFQLRQESRVREYVLSRTKITPKEYDKNLRVEWYMFAEEAKEKGCVDYIVGQDCDIDAII